MPQIQLRCRYDECGVCWQEFECNCFTSCRAGVACKHIHAVQMRHYKPKETPAVPNVTPPSLPAEETGAPPEVAPETMNQSEQPGTTSMQQRRSHLLNSVVALKVLLPFKSEIV